ncbi:CACTA en-spm transposon protein [Cucumis melo var. makuwa]|uniref:CACTA en-spm transposon protein n=1 Tax=Cucumis melo var. makuwa TaxID=1194695 RepID=A0A5A7VAF5_CUCMM|nr:CACTA en-spm transposon protein [Cucumis melo var. makuwa]TYK11664.1 CACTA en-spm transposon protein [Cucumis melo var. makuwa]
MLEILHDLQASIEHEEETVKESLENDMSFNSGIEEVTTNIFQELLNQARRELYPDHSKFSSLDFLVTLMHVQVLNDTMSNFPVGFDESEDLFNFSVEEFNIVPGTSSIRDTSDASQPITQTSKRRQNKAISPHDVRFNNTIGVLTQVTFPVHFFNQADVTPEYIELVKDDLQQWLVLDFIDPTLTRFVEHQVLTVWKEFRG